MPKPPSKNDNNLRARNGDGLYFHSFPDGSDNPFNIEHYFNITANTDTLNFIFTRILPYKANEILNFLRKYPYGCYTGQNYVWPREDFRIAEIGAKKYRESLKNKNVIEEQPVIDENVKANFVANINSKGVNRTAIIKVDAPDLSNEDINMIMAMMNKKVVELNNQRMFDEKPKKITISIE